MKAAKSPAKKVAGKPSRSVPRTAAAASRKPGASKKKSGPELKTETVKPKIVQPAVKPKASKPAKARKLSVPSLPVPEPPKLTIPTLATEVPTAVITPAAGKSGRSPKSPPPKTLSAATETKPAPVLKAKATPKKVAKQAAKTAAPIRKVPPKAFAKPLPNSAEKSKTGGQPARLSKAVPKRLAKAAGRASVALKKPIVSGPKLDIPVPPILLEGDDPAVAVPSGIGQRYQLGPAAPALRENQAMESPLPESYGTGQFMLVARDPYWLYAHWDLHLGQQRVYNRLSADGHLIVRIFESSTGEVPFSEIHVHPESKHWFIHVGKPAKRFIARLGFRQADGGWQTVATSEPADTPPDAVSEDTSACFATVPVELPFGNLLKVAQETLAEPTPLVEAVEKLQAHGYSQITVETVVAPVPGVPDEPVISQAANPGTPSFVVTAPLSERSTIPGFQPEPVAAGSADQEEIPQSIPAAIPADAFESVLGTEPEVSLAGEALSADELVALIQTMSDTPVASAAKEQVTLPVAESVAWTREMTRALIALSKKEGMVGEAMSSAEIAELVRRQLREVLSSLTAAGKSEQSKLGDLGDAPGRGIPGTGLGGISSWTKPGRPPAAKKFWFDVNAELVIYGATEPGALVTIGGRTIKLRVDGSFSYRFALPDGKYGMPVVAISPDGTDGRAAELSFSRNTSYFGEVSAHPQDPALKLPSPDNLA